MWTGVIRPPCDLTAAQTFKSCSLWVSDRSNVKIKIKKRSTPEQVRMVWSKKKHPICCKEDHGSWLKSPLKPDKTPTDTIGRGALPRIPERVMRRVPVCLCASIPPHHPPDHTGCTWRLIARSWHCYSNWWSNTGLGRTPGRERERTRAVPDKTIT